MPDADHPVSPIRRARSREIKRSAVISAAREVRTLSRAELTQLTGLSPATLTSLVRDLIKEGYLVEKGADTSQPGRPRTILEFNPAAELVVAVSLEHGGISCQLGDSDGTVLAHRDLERQPDIAEAIYQLTLELTGDRRDHLRGVAVAVPGVSSDGEVRLAPSVGVVETRPLGEGLAQRLGVPVVIDNDVDLIAVGEHRAGAGVDVDDLMLLHVSDGVGAAVVLDGKVRRGASGAAGEVGFFPVGPTTPHPAGVGPFEAQWSETAVAARLATWAPERPPGRPVADLVELAHGDQTAAQYLDELVEAWAQLIVACVCLVDPGRVLLSGAATQLDDAALEKLQTKVDTGAPAPTEIRRAALGDEAVLHGAISLALSAAGLVSSNVHSDSARLRA